MSSRTESTDPVSRLTVISQWGAGALVLATLLLFGAPATAGPSVGGVVQNAVTANGNGTEVTVFGTFVVATYSVSGTFNATVNFEGTGADEVFQPLGCVPVLNSGLAVQSTTSTGIWRCNIAGLLRVRARVSNYLSGTVTVSLQASDTGTVASDASVIIADTPSFNLAQVGGTVVSGADVVDAPNKAFRVSATVALPVNQGTQGLQRSPWFQALTDGLNGPVAVKAPFRAPTLADPALVVSIAQPVPVGVSQNSRTGGQIGPLIQGAVTTSAPGYTAGQTAPLSLTPTGALRVDSSVVIQPVSGTFFQTIQPVSGTVTANQGGAPWTQRIQDGTGTALAAVKGPFARASPVDPALVVTLSPNSPVLPGFLISQGSITGGQSGPLVQGSVTTAAPAYTTGQISPLSLTEAGLLRIDLSGIGGTAQSGANVIDVPNTAFRINCVIGCSAASFTDTSVFTAGVTSETNVGGVYNDSLSAVTSGNAAATRITTNRALHVNLRDSSGLEVGTASGPLTVSQGGRPWAQRIQDGVSSTLATVKGPFRPASAADSSLVVTLSPNSLVAAGLLSGQGSTTGGETGPIVQGAVTTAAPSYTTGQTDPLSLTPAGALRISLPSNSRSDTYTGTTSGVTVDVSASPLKSFAIQVVGTGAAATSWDVRLEGSLDNANFSQILQHTNTTGDGVVLWSGATLSPTLYMRSRTAGLILGGATNIVVTILGSQ